MSVRFIILSSKVDKDDLDPCDRAKRRKHDDDDKCKRPLKRHRHHHHKGGHGGC